MNELKQIIDARLVDVRRKLAHAVEGQASLEQISRLQGNIGALEWVLREMKELAHV
jgi:hypothetical protein